MANHKLNKEALTVSSGLLYLIKSEVRSKR